MKKFILHCIGFALFAAVVYVAALMLLPAGLKKNFFNNLNRGYLHKRIAEIDSFGKVQVLFIGSSHAYRTFDTRIYKQAGIASFNFGSNNQTPIQTYYLLKRYMHKLQPEVVVFEVNPYIFSLDGVESLINIISCDSINAGTVEMAATLQNMKAWNSLVYVWVREKLGKPYKYPVEDTRNTYISGGYVECLVNYYHSKTRPENDLPIAGRQMEYFGKVLRFLAEKNIPVLLVQAPVVHKFYNDQCAARFDARMQETGLPYYNFNNRDIHFVDTLHFWDAQHMNQFGVQLFNQAFLPVLQQKLQQKKP
jgi:hypothetical protein